MYSFEEKDEVWAIFDRDEHPQFEEAVRLCEQNGVKVGRSNPCFEVWLILHLRDWDKPDGRVGVQETLKGLLPEYDSEGAKTPDCARLMPLIAAAELRGERQLQSRENEGARFGAPSTTVFQLTRAVRAAHDDATPRAPAFTSYGPGTVRRAMERDRGKLARPARFERATPGFGGQCSIP